MNKPEMCPFCKYTRGVIRSGYYRFDLFFVHCPCCFARGPLLESKEAAIKVWNEIKEKEEDDEPEPADRSDRTTDDEGT